MRKTETERSLRPSLREIEALHAMVELRKTTSAAHRLGVSQPAVSRAIHDLERRLGCLLFRREGGRLHATADGVRFYEETLPIFAALDRLGRREPGRAGEATMRIIVPPTIGHHFLPPLLASFAQAEPHVRLQVEIGTTTDIIAKVADGNFDLGIVDAHTAHPSLVYEPVRRAYGQVAMRADSPLAARSEIRPADLDGAPLIALTRRFPSRGALEQILLEAGVRPQIRVEVATSALAYELVRTGLGVALINPFPVASFAEPEIALRPFTPRISYETVFVRPSAQPPAPATRAFMDHLRRHQPADAYSELVRKQP
jgi:DNA-binding transcriptional LysR family regulator